MQGNLNHDTISAGNSTDGISVNPKRRIVSRAVLLGAVAIITAGGMFGAARIIPPGPAIAETSAVTRAVKTPVAAVVPSFADAIERVRDAVVSVKVTVGEAGNAMDTVRGLPQMPQFAPGDPLERFFRQFGGRNPMGPGARVRRSQGSGFIISADGYVVTNNHVVRNAVKLQLTFDNGKTVDARVIGTDEKTDLALLKITQPGTYKYVEFSDKLPRVGDWVVAVGNPFGLGGTVTAGIVSARGRDINSGPYDDFLQIDAPVNRGNSGGPTFDVYGKVVGVNTAIYSPSGGSVGIGFAIPSNVAKNVIASLREKGSVSRGFIGVQIQTVSQEIAESLGLKEANGALISDATPGLPADKAGLRSGDVIVQVNGEAIANPRALARKIAVIAPGSKVTIRYIRNRREQSATLTLAAQPKQRQAALSGTSRSVSPAAASPRFGMTLAPAADVAGAGQTGVVVAEIDPSGLAARQGLRSGDVILEAAGEKVTDPNQFRDIVAKAGGNGRKAVLLRVKSANGARFVALALRPRKAG